VCARAHSTGSFRQRLELDVDRRQVPLPGTAGCNRLVGPSAVAVVGDARRFARADLCHPDSVELSAKLQIRPGQSVAVINAPPQVMLPPVTPGIDLDEADVVIGFATRRDDLDRLEQVFLAARADRIAWLGYPKAGKLGTDLNRDRLVEAVAGRGVQPVRQVSIDDTWSALRFRPAAD